MPDIFAFTTFTFNSALNHMKKLKNNAFIGNTGHVDDEIGMAGSDAWKGMKVVNIKTLPRQELEWSRCDSTVAQRMTVLSPL